MKYYAVTDDPNELMHYGIKGMKWGVIRTDAQLGHPKKPSKQRSSKPKSPAYQKAAAKLSAAMHHGIAKAQANWKAYNSPENKEIRRQQHEVNKAVRDYKRGERLFEKHVQLARQGRLKYKGISDAEVQRITDRLALERNARMLSGTEKPSLRRRVNEAIGEGIVRGVGQGTSGYIAARMTGRGNTDAKIRDEKRMAKFHNSMSGRLAEWRENQADMRAAQAEQKRANVKAALRDQYDTAKKDRDDRRANEEKYEALLIENRRTGYDNVYGDGNRFNYKGGRVTKRLSDAELTARITGLEDAKKLYGSVQDTRMKARNGTVTKEYKDENGNDVKETYSKGTNTDLFVPDVIARQHAKPARATKLVETGASKADLKRIDKQVKQAERDARKQEVAEQKARDRENRFALEKARKQLADEERMNKWGEQYERDQIRQAARNAVEEYRKNRRLEAAASNAFGQPIHLNAPTTVEDRVGEGKPYSPSSSVSQETPRRSPKKKNRGRR